MKGKWLAGFAVLASTGAPAATGATPAGPVAENVPAAGSAREARRLDHAGSYTLEASRHCVSLDLGANARLSPGPREVRVFELPIPNSVPAILDSDNEGRIWFVMGGGGFAGIHHPPLSYIGRIDISGKFDLFRLPTDRALPSGIKVAGDRIYVTEYMAGQIAVIDIPSLTVREYPLPNADGRPTGLDLDSKGNLWFNQNLGNRVGRLDPGGELVEFAIPTDRSRPTGMVVDAADVVWFAQMSGNKIGRINGDRSVSELPVPTSNARPTAMVETDDGRIWFSERAANKLAVVAGAAITEYEIPWPDTGPFFLVDGKDGGIWFTQLNSSAVGRLDVASRSFKRIVLPASDGWPAGLGFDTPGNLWITFQLANRVAVIERESKQC